MHHWTAWHCMHTRGGQCNAETYHSLSPLVPVQLVHRVRGVGSSDHDTRRPDCHPCNSSGARGGGIAYPCPLLYVRRPECGAIGTHDRVAARCHYHGLTWLRRLLASDQQPNPTPVSRLWPARM